MSIDRPTGDLELRVDRGLAYEALISLAMAHGEVRPERYMDGQGLQRRFRELPERLRRTILRTDSGFGFNWSDLIGLVPAARRPRDVPDLLRVLASMEPLELKLTMLGSHVREYRQAIGEEVFREAAAGQPSAVRAFKRQAGRSVRAGVTGPLLGIKAALVAERTIEVLESLPRAFYQPAPDTAGLLTASARQAGALKREHEPRVVVERMTRGIVYPGEAGVDRLLLIPTVIHRPWTLIVDYDTTKIFCYPVFPPTSDGIQPELVGVYRALGDETRLRMLRRLAAGRATFGQLSREMGLAKSTIHQHALILRTAGLIRLHYGSRSGLDLNPNLPRLDRLLADFLAATGPGSRSRPLTPAPDTIRRPAR